jgi:hypothetical protein
MGRVTSSAKSIYVRMLQFIKKLIAAVVRNNQKKQHSRYTEQNEWHKT